MEEEEAPFATAPESPVEVTPIEARAEADLTEAVMGGAGLEVGLGSEEMSCGQVDAISTSMGRSAEK